MTKKLLRMVALVCATKATPLHAATKTRHEFILWRAQKFYDWLVDPNQHADRPSDDV